MFSHVFIEAKMRLKKILKENIIYTDGLTVEEINSKINQIQVSEKDTYLEGDFAKFDRQVDEHMTELEYQLYNLLGIDQDLLSFYLRVKKNWRFKSQSDQGMLNMMRLTGEPPTALGNVLINLISMCDLVEKLGKALKLMLILGDDNLLIGEFMLDLS